MSFKYLDKDKVLSAEIFGQTMQYLINEYGQSRNQLTPASPYTQILLAQSEITELIFYYLENALSEMNMVTARSPESVYGNSRITGHDPTRATAATGKITLRLKPGYDGEFEGDYMIIPKFSKMTLLNNGLTYVLIPNTDDIKIQKHSTEVQQALIVQGIRETQTEISTGQPLQSFSVITKDMTDHFMVKVYINGEQYTKYDSLYDMRKDDKGYILKTGINGGLDVYFGNLSFGYIPPAGSNIEIEYFKTSGASGNIGSLDEVVINFEDPGYDKYGNEIDLNEALLVVVDIPPFLGSNTESMNFTKLIAPHASRSFVLANASNYIYFLRRYGYFSVVDAYSQFDDDYLDDDNVIYLFLLPDITQKMRTDLDYFNIAEDEFTLSDIQLNYIKALINESGQQMISAELEFVQPIVKKYALTVILRYFDIVDKEDIYENIRTKLSEYFLNVKRRDKIPRSDIISIIENINGVDSVSVYFVSEENEEAMANGYYYKNIYGYDTEKKINTLLENKKITLTDGENPSIGLDEFGDIIIGKHELPLIRGGWNNRDGSYYEIFPDNTKLSSLNIMFKEKISMDMYNQIMQNKRKQIKDS